MILTSAHLPFSREEHDPYRNCQELTFFDRSCQKAALAEIKITKKYYLSQTRSLQCIRLSIMVQPWIGVEDLVDVRSAKMASQLCALLI